MLRFLFRRLLVAIPTLLVVITLAFFLMRAAPGGPFDTDRILPPEVVAAMEARFGLDKPLPVQYVEYLGNVVTGDFGPSMKYQDKTVLDFIKEGFPVSLKIGLSALILAMGVGVTLGSLAALRQNTPADYSVTAIAILGVCVPTFVTAPLLLLLGKAVDWGLPSGGWNDGALPNMVLPVIVLSLPQIAIISRLTRAGMVEVLRSNYVRTARAKGLSEWTIVTRHALRGAILPLVAYLGPACAGVITGSLVIEEIFQLPGLGRSFIIGALQRDYPVVMGVVILYGALIIVLNLVADLLTALLDPRVRLS
ncbi:oligopeptide ABC transporter permease OppB [Brevundimonas sp. 2R-24]|uniref:Oligopeptide ABC transporter permease OppB n=1 Tax=Peiella sedimenti TaxID=3061083 RepID=A0ABT8SMU6_9CAUL|nr:oligopeptide ABC transporter permease OppB [Caulobacteraceae bacterium XZ-24]